jgi:peptidoglycan/LPS O-acetylase OafA/YrhL
VITRSLLFDARENGSISLYSFYLRRVFRILPALWVMAIAAAIVAALLRKPEWGETLAALSSTMNWARAFELLPGGGALGHAWSLSIEEQFYLLWPITLILLLRAPPGLRWALLCLALPAITLWRFLLIAHGADVERIYNGLDTHADGLLLGCVMALWGRPPPRLVSRTWFVPLAILLVSVFCATPPGTFFDGTMYLWLALLSAWLIWAATGRETFMHPVLRSSLAQWGGTRSYSLYLWHYPIIFFLIPAGLGAAAKAGIELAGTLVAAELSYRLVELPALRARPRFDAFVKRLFGKSAKMPVPADGGAEEPAE